MKLLNAPAEVQCYHDTKGNIVPLQVSYTARNLKPIKITGISVINTADLMFAGKRLTKYVCQANINGDERVFELHRFWKNMKWFLHKI